MILLIVIIAMVAGSGTMVFYCVYLAITQNTTANQGNSESIKPEANNHARIPVVRNIDKEISVHIDNTENKLENTTRYKSENIYFLDSKAVSENRISNADIKVMIDNYFSGLINEIRNAKKSIYILDYFSHGVDINKNEFFYHALQIAQKKYLKEIELTVKKNPDLEYTRILQLPLEKLLPFGTSEIPIFIYATYALSLIDKYSPTWNHIVNLNNVNNFKLHILPVPLRTPSEMIIDDNVWFFESDSYHKGTKANPDLLFLHKAEESLSIQQVISYEKSLIIDATMKYPSLTRKQLGRIINIISKSDIKPLNTGLSNL